MKIFRCNFSRLLSLPIPQIKIKKTNYANKFYRFERLSFNFSLNRGRMKIINYSTSTFSLPVTSFFLPRRIGRKFYGNLFCVLLTCSEDFFLAESECINHRPKHIFAKLTRTPFHSLPPTLALQSVLKVNNTRTPFSRPHQPNIERKRREKLSLGYLLFTSRSSPDATLSIMI